MKKTIALMLALIIVIYLAGCSRVRIIGEPEGKVIYNHDTIGVSFSDDLTEEELETVIGILNGKERNSTLVYGAPSCGFTPEIAFVIGGTTYMMACDTCGTLMIYGSFDYIDVSEKEQDALEAIFTSRGGKFPCV